MLAAEEIVGATATLKQTPSPSRRKKDLTSGALLMFVVALMVAAAGIDLPPSHSGRIIILIVAWLILTLLINIVPLWRYFFGGDGSSASGGAPSKLSVPGFFKRAAPTHQQSLPPAHSLPVTSVGVRPVNTSEVVRPPSVTEGTTNLLNNK